MLGVRCERSLLSDQVAHFLSFVKSGCDAAEFHFWHPDARLSRNAGRMILPSAFGEFVAAGEIE